MRSSFLLVIFLTTSGLFGQINLEEPFRQCNVTGSITIYDYNARKWISSDIADSHYPTLPASTFKILNTLIALETGVIADEKEIVRWPGETDTVKYGYRPNIYHDMNLEEAFRLSAVWVYLDLAKKIGKENYKDFLRKSNYGNTDVSIGDLDFWNFGDLALKQLFDLHPGITIVEASEYLN